MSAGKYYDVSKHAVLSSINVKFVSVTIAGVITRVLFVRNLAPASATPSNSVVVVDNQTGIAYTYPSFKSLAKALMSIYNNKKADASVFSKACASGKPYRKR